MQVGFIGTGSMGSILIEALIATKALHPTQVLAFNRTPSKVKRLVERFPGLQEATDNAELAHESDIIFLCVKPKEHPQAIHQIRNHLTKDKILVTITSPVNLSELENLVPSPVIRVVPSITNAAFSGLTLVEFGAKATEEHRQLIIQLISHMSHPIEIQEKFLRVSSDITSCGPAFISYILQQMIKAAHEETGISEEAATFLTSKMMIGFAELLQKEVFTLPQLQKRVCVPGGITGEGLKALEKGLPGVFQEVFQRTHEKFSEDQSEMKLLLEETKF